MKNVSGFSKLSKLEKIDFLLKDYLDMSAQGYERTKQTLQSFWHHARESERYCPSRAA